MIKTYLYLAIAHPFIAKYMASFFLMHHPKIVKADIH